MKTSNLSLRIFCILGPLLCPYAATAEEKPELLFVSSEAIAGILGCRWEYCGSRNISEHELEQQAARSLVDGRWFAEFKRRQRRWRNRNYSRYSTLRQVRPGDIHSTYAILWDGNQVAAAWRYRPDRIEEELRPMFQGAFDRPRFSLDRFESVQFIRRQRSFAVDDVSRYESLSLEDFALYERFGLKWGMNHQEILRALEDDFSPRELREFFLNSRWNFPSFKEMLSTPNMIFTPGSWSTKHEPEIIYHLFVRKNGEEVRIVTLLRGEGLQRIENFTSDGVMTIVSPPEGSRRVRNFPRVVEDVGLTWGAAPPDDWSELQEFILVNPQDFFRTAGYPFADWRERFEASSYSYDTDQSWSDLDGNRYYIFLDRYWNFRWSEQPTRRKPAWFMLQFSSNEGGWALERQYFYDEEWNENVILPGEAYFNPGRYKAKRAIGWLSRNWPLTLIVLVVMLLFLAYRWSEAVRRRMGEELQQQERQEAKRRAQEERDRAERERKQKSRAFVEKLSTIDLYIREEHFAGAYRFLDELLCDHPDEKIAILQGRQRVQDAEYHCQEKKVQRYTGRLQDLEQKLASPSPNKDRP